MGMCARPELQELQPNAHHTPANCASLTSAGSMSMCTMHPPCTLHPSKRNVSKKTKGASQLTAVNCSPQPGQCRCAQCARWRQTPPACLQAGSEQRRNTHDGLRQSAGAEGALPCDAQQQGCDPPKTQPDSLTVRSCCCWRDAAGGSWSWHLQRQLEWHLAHWYHPAQWLFLSPVTRSSKRAPNASSRSASLTA